MTATADVDGSTAPRFAPVADAFREHLSDVGAGGAAFAACVDGELVVDLWAGCARRGEPWREDTLAVLMSTTKGVATVCLQMLVERGLLDVGERVARYWPEFAANGKADITVADVLIHSAGVITLPGHERLLDIVTGEGFDDTGAIASALADATPAWPPGSRSGYHAFTWGWIIAEIVERIEGRTIGRFFREEIGAPLGLDLWIGTPPDLHHRVAACIADPAPPPPMDVGPETAAFLAEASLTRPDGSSLIAALPAISTRGPYLAAEVPAANGTGTARAVARVFSALASGGEIAGRRLFGPAVIEEFRTVRVTEPDVVIGVPFRRALGYHTNGPPMWAFGPNERAFGHGGAGGQMGCADPERGVAMGFVRTQFSMLSPLRQRLVETLYGCLA